MRAQMSESFQYFCFRNVFSIKALRTNRFSTENLQANLIAHAHVEFIWEPIQTQRVPCHLGLRYARCKAPCRMIPRGLCGRAPSIHHLWYKKQRHQLSFHHGLRSARCKNPCRMIHCGPRARAPQSGTSRPACKQRCKVNIVVLSGMLRVPLPSSGDVPASCPREHAWPSVPPACPHCFLCCGRAGRSGRGPLTRSSWLT